MTLSITTTIALVGAALVAGTIDAIAGGGGLITVPSLITSGLASHLALGTNKGQSVWGSLAALIAYYRAGTLHKRQAIATFPAGFIGAIAGAHTVLAIPKNVLRVVVIVLLVSVSLLLAIRRVPVTKQSAQSTTTVPRNLYKAAAIAFVIGAYDGFFGPGTGTFLITAFVLWLGVNLTQASSDAKVVNFASNLASVIVFAWKGVVIWPIAIPMAVAQFTGGLIGAKIALRGGEKLIRWVVFLVVIALCTKLFIDVFRSPG